jgi:hypothetical protein
VTRCGAIVPIVAIVTGPLAQSVAASALATYLNKDPIYLYIFGATDRHAEALTIGTIATIGRRRLSVEMVRGGILGPVRAGARDKDKASSNLRASIPRASPARTIRGGVLLRSAANSYFSGHRPRLRAIRGKVPA